MPQMTVGTQAKSAWPPARAMFMRVHALICTSLKLTADARGVPERCCPRLKYLDALFGDPTLSLGRSLCSSSADDLNPDIVPGFPVLVGEGGWLPNIAPGRCASNPDCIELSPLSGGHLRAIWSKCLAHVGTVNLLVRFSLFSPRGLQD
jgi:hypothetical protein